METASGMNELHPEEGVLEQATMRPRRVCSKERLVGSSRLHTAYSACDVCQHAVVSISSVYSLSEIYLIRLMRGGCWWLPSTISSTHSSTTLLYNGMLC